jgi:hypothetical protein
MSTSPSGSAPQFSERAASILATEHWSLLGTRSMAWNEAFSRTNVFLNTLSASVVALALVADATGFDDSFFGFALVLFPIVLFLGVATYVKLVQINTDDIYQVRAMNRLRRAYLDIAPELEPFFTAGAHDDESGIWATLRLGGTHPSRPWVYFLVTTPTVIATVDSIVVAAGVALLASRFEVTGFRLIVISLAAAIGVWALLFSLQLQTLRTVRAETPRFPRLRRANAPTVLARDSAFGAQAIT